MIVDAGLGSDPWLESCTGDIDTYKWTRYRDNWTGESATDYGMWL